MTSAYLLARRKRRSRSWLRRNEGGTYEAVKASVKLMWRPTLSSEAIANAAARSESSINTIALAASIRFAAKHARVRSVATTQRPKSSAFTVSMSLEDYRRIRDELLVQQSAME